MRTISFACLLIVAVGGPLSAAETAEAVKCINTLAKGYAKLASLQVKVLNKCVKAFAADPAGNPDPDNCAFRDDKVRDAVDSLQDVAGALCVGAGNPTFGEGEAWQAAMNAGTSLGFGLVAGVWHGLDTDTVRCSDNPEGAGCKCQNAVLGQTAKLFNLQAKLFNKCLKAGLKDGTIVSDTELASCMTNNSMLDPADKIGAAIAKMGAAVGKKCGAPVTDPLPNGKCATLTGEPLNQCLAAFTRCSACLGIGQATELLSGLDCDTYDDGAANLSCYDYIPLF